MAVPLLAEAIRGGMKQRFKDRIQETANHLLSDPITDRSAERSARVGDSGGSLTLRAAAIS